MEYQVTERERKALYKELWKVYRRLRALPRSYRSALCARAVCEIVGKLQEGHPAYDSLREALAAAPGQEIPPPEPGIGSPP